MIMVYTWFPWVSLVFTLKLVKEMCDGHTYVPTTSALTFFHLVKVSVHSACLGYLGQFKNYAVPIQKTSIYLYILVILKEYQYY